MTDHLYEMRRGDGGLGAPRLWCASVECRGHGLVVADPHGDGVFPQSWLVRRMAIHAVTYGNATPVAPDVTEIGGIVKLPPDLSWVARTDVKASWDIRMPEQPRGHSGWLVLLGAALAVAGGLLGRFLGWS